MDYIFFLAGVSLIVVVAIFISFVGALIWIWWDHHRISERIKKYLMDIY